MPFVYDEPAILESVIVAQFASRLNGVHDRVGILGVVVPGYEIGRDARLAASLQQSLEVIDVHAAERRPADLDVRKFALDSL